MSSHFKNPDISTLSESSQEILDLDNFVKDHVGEATFVDKGCEKLLYTKANVRIRVQLQKSGNYAGLWRHEQLAEEGFCAGLHDDEALAEAIMQSIGDQLSIAQMKILIKKMQKEVDWFNENKVKQNLGRLSRS